MWVTGFKVFGPALAPPFSIIRWFGIVIWIWRWTDYADARGRFVALSSIRNTLRIVGRTFYNPECGMRCVHIFRHSMQPDEDLNRSKPVVAVGLSRVISLLLVLIWIYSDLCFILFIYYSYCVLIFLLFHFRLNLSWS